MNKETAKGRGAKSTRGTGGGRLSRTEVAFQQIKQMFLAGELVPGQKLRYQDLTKKLGVSQTPIIQALTRLENEGLVASEANKGFFVPEIDLDELRELYEIREVMEVFLIRLAVENYTPRDLEEIENLAVEHRSHRGDLYNLERLWLDARFHLALAAYSGHRTGQVFLRQVFQRIYLRYRPERLAQKRMNSSEDEHKGLLAAMRVRDADEAARVMRAHISRGKNYMLSGLKQEAETVGKLIPWE